MTDGRSGTGVEGGTSRSRGFTLLELLVTLALFSLLLASVWSTVTSQGRSYVAQDALMEIQTSIQLGFNEVSLDLMHAGYGKVYAQFHADGCRPVGFLQAAPFQVAFLYDIDNSLELNPGSPDGPRLKLADSAGFVSLCDEPGCTGHCSATPNTGAAADADMHAEVVRWTLDKNGDARVLDSDGATLLFTTASGELAATNVGSADMDTTSQNPNDYILFREVNDRTAPNGEDVPFSYGLRGPDASGNWPQDAAGNWMPMFLYYLDENGDGKYDCTGGAGSDHIFGDTNLDCTLDNSEVNAMMTGAASAKVVPQDDLWKVLGTKIQLRGETKRPDADYDQNNGYRFRILTGGAKANNLAF